jgi:hypothetical protein
MDRTVQVLGGSVLEQEAACAGPKSVVHVLVEVEGGEDEHPDCLQVGVGGDPTGRLGCRPSPASGHPSAAPKSGGQRSPRGSGSFAHSSQAVPLLDFVGQGVLPVVLRQPGISDWTPTGAATTLIDPASQQVTTVSASGAALVGYAAVFSAAAWTFVHRDPG